MSRMSRSCIVFGGLRRCVLLCVGICLFLSLAPCTDFDLDGSSDSLTTDGLILGPAIPYPIIPTLLLRKPNRERLAPPPAVSTRIARPPIA